MRGRRGWIGQVQVRFCLAREPTENDMHLPYPASTPAPLTHNPHTHTHPFLNCAPSYYTQPPPTIPVCLRAPTQTTVLSCPSSLITTPRTPTPLLPLYHTVITPTTYLYACWPPLDEWRCLALPYALQSLVHLAGVHLPLNDVED